MVRGDYISLVQSMVLLQDERQVGRQGRMLWQDAGTACPGKLLQAQKLLHRGLCALQCCTSKSRMCIGGDDTQALCAGKGRHHPRI